MINLILILYGFIFAQDANHLLITKVVTQPNNAESFSIYNPTNSTIDLTNYYISDNRNYYKIAEGIMNPATSVSDFIAKFPSIYIESKETLTIVLNENYSNYFLDNFTPDLFMFNNGPIKSLLETENNSFGLMENKLDEDSEILILFYWEMDSEIVQDVDYFIWGHFQSAIDKSSINNYKNDISGANQLFFEEIADTLEAYSRIGENETNEILLNGNGISGHDETSEDFRSTWEIIELFNIGCMNPNALNFKSDAEKEREGDCILSIQTLNEGNYLGKNIKTTGIIVDYVDFSLSSCSGAGPKVLTLEDQNNYAIELIIWEDDLVTELDSIISCPFSKYKIFIDGLVNEYCRGAPQNCEDFSEFECQEEKNCKCKWDNENSICYKSCKDLQTNWNCDSNSRKKQSTNNKSISKKWNLNSYSESESINPDCSLQIEILSVQNISIDTTYNDYKLYSPTNYEEVYSNKYFHKAVQLRGIITDYVDITEFCGPHALKLSENLTGNSLELTYWDNEWNNELECLIQPPFYSKEIIINGFVNEYQGNQQIQVCGDIEILNQNYNFQAQEVSISSILDGTHNNKVVTCSGVLIDYFDVTVYDGPHSLTIEDEQGYRMELSIWPDNYDIPNSNLSYLLEAPYNKYSLKVIGNITEFDGEKQITISSADAIFVTDTINYSGKEYDGLLVTFKIETNYSNFILNNKDIIFKNDLSSLLGINTERSLIVDIKQGSVIITMNIKDRLPLDDIEPTNNELLNLIPSIATIGEFEVEILELLQLTTNKTTIKPEPYIIIPTLGETLDFSFSFPDNSRVVIRIYDLSGRFITSLVDKYYKKSGTVFRDDYHSSWNGRDNLGQIVSPGTYIMHIESINPETGETQNDAAPIVVGVKN